MTTPRNSNIKNCDNNNQEVNMREQLLANQTQLNQVTTQFLANNKGLDPTMQKFLEIQSQLLQGMATQMINMGDNSSQGVYDNKDVKDDILEGTQACNICGNKDHTSKEHEDQCPNCEKKHPTNQCPTSQATCFLCEGNNHVPIQCPIYSIVEQRKQGGLQQMIAKYPEGSKSTKKNEDKGKAPLIPPCNTTQFKGPKKRHMNYPKSNRRSKKKVNIPTYKITYEQHELDALLALEKPKKKKDKSHVQCHHCKEMGHYSSECPEKQKYKEIGQVWYNNCKELGHYAATCPQQTREELKLITCFNCKEQGHYASNCPEKMKNKINKPMEDLSLDTC